MISFLVTVTVSVVVSSEGSHSFTVRSDLVNVACDLSSDTVTPHVPLVVTFEILIFDSVFTGYLFQIISCPSFLSYLVFVVTTKPPTVVNS